MKETLKRFYHTVKGVLKSASKNSVYAYAGHSALFIIISFFPLLMLLLASVKYMPFSEKEVLELVSAIPLGSANNTLNTAIREVYARSGSLALSISAITLLWSASTSIYSITRGLNAIYGHTETRNYFLLRGLSLLYTVLFIIALLVLLVLMVFGGGILAFIYIKIPFLSDFSGMINVLRGAVTYLSILLFIDLMYTFIPNRRSNMIKELPGAIISSICWYGFSFGYSVYIENFSNVSFVYGSLTAVVLLMIWLYILMYIFFIGAAVNKTKVFKKKGTRNE